MAPFWIAAFLVAIFGAHWTGTIAQEKGHSYREWTIYALLLLIVALPVALYMKPSGKVAQKCPHCISLIPLQATVCPRCTRDLTPVATGGLGPCMWVEGRRCQNIVVGTMMDELDEYLPICEEHRQEEALAAPWVEFKAISSSDMNV